MVDHKLDLHEGSVQVIRQALQPAGILRGKTNTAALVNLLLPVQETIQNGTYTAMLGFGALKEKLWELDKESVSQYESSTSPEWQMKEYNETMQKAEEVLWKEVFDSLTPDQKWSIFLAHIVGYGEVGLDGKVIWVETAGVNNYTPVHNRRKYKLLRDAWLDKPSARVLMEKGVCGFTWNEVWRNDFWLYILHSLKPWDKIISFSGTVREVLSVDWYNITVKTWRWTSLYEQVITKDHLLNNLDSIEKIVLNKWELENYSDVQSPIYLTERKQLIKRVSTEIEVNDNLFLSGEKVTITYESSSGQLKLTWPNDEFYFLNKWEEVIIWYNFIDNKFGFSNFVSWDHCSIYYGENGKIYVTDMSSNGTRYGEKTSQVVQQPWVQPSPPHMENTPPLRLDARNYVILNDKAYIQQRDANTNNPTTESITVLQDAYVATYDFANTKYNGEQQDALGVIRTNRGILLSVCDGMGGEKWWAARSKYVINTIVNNAEYAAELLKRQDNGKAYHQFIAEQQKLSWSPREGDAVLVTAYIEWDYLYAWNVWDAQIKVFQRWFGSWNQRVKYESQDHSVVGEMNRAWILNTNAVNYHPNNNIVTSSVNDPTKVWWATVKLDHGDFVLLFSDWLTEVLNHNLNNAPSGTRTIGRKLEQISSSPEQMVRNLHELIVAIKQEQKYRQGIDISEFQNIYNTDNIAFIAYQHP